MVKKIPQRKQRKRERRSKDKKPRRQKRKKDDGLRELAKEFMIQIPRKSVEYANKKFLCSYCHLYYCVGFDGVDVFCRECIYKLGCLKTTNGAIKQCNFCKRREGNIASYTKH